MTQPLYLPFADGQWRLAMGLKPLSLSDWLEIDETFAAQLQTKTQLLQKRHSDVFASLPDSLAAQQETLDLLVAHLLHYFPDYYRRQGNQISNLVTGQVWNLTDFAAPLDLAGRLVQEDLCLMLPASEGYVLSAASLCFPLRWRLRSKLGQPMGQIHHDVPDYDQKLQRPVDQFFQRLNPDYPGYRLNWSILDTPELFLGDPKSQVQPDHFSEITSQNAGSLLWLRVERQTLRRLPVSNAILFTIRTYVHRLDQVVADDPGLAAALAGAIQQIPAAMQGYKNLLPIQPALLTYLATVSAKSIYAKSTFTSDRS